MTGNELKNRYLDWLCDLIHPIAHHKLLAHLHGVDFFYKIALDGNRAEDGVELRYRFGCLFRYPEAEIAAYLDDRPCSVLEMMVALAVRAEEHIMVNPDIGNRTAEWFWGMVESLGLGSMTDERFDVNYVDKLIFRFLNRQHKPNGEGGLFTIKNYRRDLRSVEIWYQMCWYMNDIL